jgi:hypothetical protein
VAEQLPGKLAVDSGDEFDRRAWIEIAGIEKAPGIEREPVIKIVAVALDRSIEALPAGVDIESLKSKLLHYATREIHDPSDDMISTIEVMVRNTYRGLLKDDLHEIFKIIDKVSDKDIALAIYHMLNRVVGRAVVAGMNDPNPTLVEYRKKTEEWEGRAKRKANVAALKRREKMRPFIEDSPRARGFSGLAAMYKALMGRPEFVSVVQEAEHRSRLINKDNGEIPKGLNPRQIKGDIEAILVALDAEAELAEKAGLDENAT